MSAVVPPVASTARVPPATPVVFVNGVALSGLTVGTNNAASRTVCEPEPVAPAPVPPDMVAEIA